MPAGSGSITRTFESGLSSSERGVIVYVALPGSVEMNVLSTVLPRVMSIAWTSTVALALATQDCPPPSLPVSVASFVNVWCGGDPAPLVTAPARAVIVIVPAFAVFAATVPGLQRTIVRVPGMTVGAPSDGDDELDT